MTTLPSPPRHRNGFKVGIICALSLEAKYVRSLFDKCWDDEGKHYGKAEKDQNAYTTGLIGRHNVVLAHMPNMGNTTASAVATNLHMSFKCVQIALVVGICGAMPRNGQTGQEILLGDVIISTAVVQYDLGKRYPNGFRRKGGHKDSLGRASRDIRSLAAKLEVPQDRERVQRHLGQYLKHLNTSFPAVNYPGTTQDRLYESTYIHQHRNGQDLCDQCLDDTGTCSKNCDELGCEDSKLVSRERHFQPAQEQSNDFLDHTPSVHLGTFGSANTVMKSGSDRDKIAKADNVIAFEMEGAGFWDELPTVVIKSACDYADSHKNDDWQEYAAAAAAAGMKAFLEEWAVTFPSEEQDPFVWLVPFAQGEGFVGRNNELHRLKHNISQSQSGRTVALLGLGGVGKSRLALELAFDVRSERSVFWVQATDQSTFENSMLEIGKKLRIPGIGDEKAEVMNLVKQRLSDPHADPWLLIVDNADDEALWAKNLASDKNGVFLSKYLPVTLNGSIVVTTRTQNVATCLARQNVIKLDKLSLKEASQMLTSELQQPEKATDVAENSVLVERLCQLPLAIVQGASFINMTHGSVKTYLKLLDGPEERVIKLLSKEFGDQFRLPNANNAVATTWLISFDHIYKNHELAAAYLLSMAYLHEKNIPQTLLPTANTDFDHAEAIGVLSGYSFIEKETSDHPDLGEIYHMHRLVHLATRNWLREKQLNDYVEACIIRASEEFPPQGFQYKSRWAVYLPHGERLYTESSGRNVPERYKMLEKMGLYLRNDGNYNRAVEILAAVMEWRESAYGYSDKRTLTAYSNLGTALWMQGNFDDGESYLKKAVNGQSGVLGKTHPETLASQSNLASIYQHQGRFKEAEELGLQMIEIIKRVLGAEHPDTLTSQSNLASIYQDQGRFKEAEELELQVIKIKRVLGAEHPDTLINQSNLALIYQYQGRFKEAEELGLQVIEIKKRVLSVEHPDTLISQSNLASIYQYQGRFKEAEELGLQVIKITKRVLGAEHPDTLASQSNLASIYQHQGRFKEAEELGLQMIEITKRVLGAEHPDTLASQSNLALIYRLQGRFREAEELGLQVIEIKKRVLDAEHPDTLISQSNLASIYQLQGRFKEAEELELQVIKIRKQVLGAEHPNTLTSQSNLALIYRLQGRFKEAEELELQEIEITKRVLGAEHPDTLTSMHNRAHTLKQLGRDREAMTLMKTCVILFVKVLGVEHPHTQSARTTLMIWHATSHGLEQRSE